MIVKSIFSASLQHHLFMNLKYLWSSMLLGFDSRKHLQTYAVKLIRNVFPFRVSLDACCFPKAENNRHFMSKYYLRLSMLPAYQTALCVLIPVQCRLRGKCITVNEVQGSRQLINFIQFLDNKRSEVAYIVFQTVKILTTHTCKNLFSCICVHVDVTGNTLSNERQKLKSKGANQTSWPYGHRPSQ